MNKPSHNGITTRAVGHSAIGSCLWRRGGTLHLTAIVKANFAIDESGALSRTSAPAIAQNEQHEQGSPLLSIRVAHENVPLSPRAEVLLRAQAFSDASGNKGHVRMLVSRDNSALIDKSAVVYGKRASADDEPEPFESMVLGYEKALGGIGFQDNPLGTGAGTMTTKPPNIVHPATPHETPVGFGPIPSSWPQRKSLRGTFSFKQLRERIIPIPDDLAWDCFQSAPRDQQVERLYGDEQVQLFGMLPEGKELSLRLPQLHAQTRLNHPDAAHGVPAEIPVHLAVVLVDVISGQLSLLWRGYTPLPDSLNFAALTVSGAAEEANTEIAWPLAEVQSVEPHHTENFNHTISVDPSMVDATQIHQSSDDDAASSSRPSKSQRGTADADDIERIRLRATMPFQETYGQAAKPSPSRTAAAHVGGRDTEDFTGTIGLDGLPEEPLAHLPFASAKATAASEEATRQKRLAEEDAKAQAAAAAEEKARLREEQLKAERLAAENKKKKETEAEARRQQEAAKFAEQQEAARKAEEERAAKKEARRQQSGKNFRNGVYSGLGRRQKK